MYQPQQNQAKISPGLSALMELQRTAAATTPDGAPTIASQVAQKVQGMQGQGQGIGQPQDQGQAPQGIAGIAPNLPPEARNAAVGAQIGQQQQQQAQQAMMQMAQQQTAAQKPPGPLQLAQGGIAGLPADNMHNMGRYAHGGVIGFAGNGETGSEVFGNPMAADMASTSGYEKGTEDKQLSAVARIAQMREERAAKAKEVIDSLPPEVLAAILPQGTARPAATPAPAAENSTVDIPEVKQPAFKTDPTTGLIAQGSAPAAPAPVGVAKVLPTPTAQPVQLNRAGANAQLNKAPPTQTVPGMGAAPTMETAEAINARVKAMSPDVDMTGYNNALAKRDAVIKERPDFNTTAIADLTKAEEKRKALEASRVSSSAIDRLIAFTANAGYRPGGGGTRVAAFDEKQQQLAQMNQQAEAMFDASIRKEKEAEFATKMGDADKGIALAQQAVDMRQRADATRAQITGQAIGAAATVFNAQAHAESQRLTNVSNEKIAAELNRYRLEEAKLTHGDMISKQSFIDNQAMELAKAEGLNKPLPRHQLAARTMFNAASPEVQTALINSDQRRQTAANVAQSKVQIATQKALSDWTLGAGAKYRKDLSTPEAKAAFKNYLTLTHNPAESEGVTGEQILGAMDGGSAAPSAGATGKVDTTGWSAKGGS
jgi:hypothetical protein